MARRLLRMAEGDPTRAMTEVAPIELQGKHHADYMIDKKGKSP
jgi:hypothetical protein